MANMPEPDMLTPGMSTPARKERENEGITEFNLTLTVDAFVPSFTSVPSSQRTCHFFAERENVLAKYAPAEAPESLWRYIDALKDKLGEANSAIVELQQRRHRPFPLLELPVFLLQMVASELDTLKDLTNLIRVNKALAEVVTPVLYRIAREARFDTKKIGVLHEAARYGRIHVAKKLLAYGADVNGLYLREIIHGVYRNDGTPLHSAVEKGMVETVGFLLDSGASVHTTNEQGHTPLLQAIHSLRCGLVCTRIYRIVELLLMHGSDVNYVATNDYHMALHRLIKHRLSPRWLLAKIISHGADPSALNGDGLSAVRLAARYLDDTHCYDAMRMLVRSGGDINQRSKCNTTIVHEIIQQQDAIVRSPKWLEDMVGLGADVKAKDYNGHTALHLVASQTHVNARDLLEKLIECGADITSTDNNGRTPLDLAKRAQIRWQKQAATKSTKDLKWYHDYAIKLLESGELGPEQKLWARNHNSTSNNAELEPMLANEGSISLSM